MAGDEQAEQVAIEYRAARAESDTNYDKASAAATSQRILSEEDRDALNLLWRKLVKLFHPDRFASEPEKKAAFEKLTAAINQARDEGNIELLREIHESPEHELLTLSQTKPLLIEEVAAQQRKAISDEIAALNEEAARLQPEIDELSAAGDATIA
jgi:DNA polymerase-3 subunit epsilon